MKSIFGLFAQVENKGVAEFRFVDISRIASEGTPESYWWIGYDRESGPFNTMIFVRCDRQGGVSDHRLVMREIEKAASEACRELELVQETMRKKDRG